MGVVTSNDFFWSNMADPAIQGAWQNAWDTTGYMRGVCTGGGIIYQHHDGRGLVSQNPGACLSKPIKEGTCPVLEVTDIETAARWSNFQI